MGQTKTALPTKLFIGMLSPEPELFTECAVILSTEYGDIDLESDVLPWEITDYYQEEMGSRIFRKFLFFKQLKDPACLSRVKLFTNAVEARFTSSSSGGSHRRINLDPGYITEAKVVLASTKDFSHRIYIGDNMYAEVTLQYSTRARSFTSLNHTYFDFRTDTYIALFNQARTMLRLAMNR